MSITWRDDSNPESYEKARTNHLFNALIPSRYPLAIISARTETDVLDAVRLAIDKNCRLSVRAGGHSFAAWSVRDDAILLDLGEYAELDLDEGTGVVSVSPSTTGGDLDRYVSARGRIVSVGHCSRVGMGGFLLGGGIGWNTPSWGWACEQVTAVDVVTAAGQLVRADAEHNSDLFWGVRGAGPAFPGIVTRFHIQTRPVPKIMRTSGYTFPGSLYRPTMEWAVGLDARIQGIGYTGDREISAIGMYNPDFDEFCVTVTLFVTGDDESAIENMLRAVHASCPGGAVSSWFNEETTIQKQLGNTDKAYPANHRYCVDNVLLEKDTAAVAAMERIFTTLPTRKSLVLWNPLTPASRRRPRPDMAVSMRADHYVAVYSIWENEADDNRCQSWVRHVMEEIAGDSVGSYVGEYDFQARPAKLWGEEEYRRLREIRQQWDPTGRICGCLGLEDMDV